MIKRIFAAAIAGLVAAVVVYAFVPRPRPAVAQFADQGTWGGTSTGSANAQAFTIYNLNANKPGIFLHFVPGFTNTGPTQINVSGLGLVNVVRPSSIGNVAFSGGEFQAGELTCVVYTGSVYQLGCNVDARSIGQTVDFRGGTAPRGTLIEDGTCFSTTGQYAPLFAVIGTTYNALAPVSCTGSQFAVPDSRGTGFMALDGQGANGSAGRITSLACATPNTVGLCGSQGHTQTISEMPSHNHPGSSNGGAVTTGGALAIANGAGSTLQAATLTIASQGGGAVMPVLNPFLFGRRAIKY